MKLHMERQHKMIRFLKDMLKVKTEKQRMEDYLSDSANLVDLENRLRNIERGNAPWQINAKMYCRGFV